MKRSAHTESAPGRLLTESIGTCAEETTGLLLLLLLLRLRSAESTGAETSRLLRLGLTKRTEPGPALLLWLLLLLLWLLLLWLLLTKRTKSCSGGSSSGSKSAGTTTESRRSGLCGLGLAEQASRCRRLCCRVKRTRTKPSSRGGCLTILLVVLQPEFLRRAKSAGE